MNRNPASQQPNVEPKPEAVTSLVLGIITILLAVILAAAFYFKIWGRSSVWEGITVILAGLSFFWGWLFAMTGIALGIMGLKSIKRNFAVTGIILSSTAIVFYFIALLTDIHMYIGAIFYY